MPTKKPSTKAKAKKTVSAKPAAKKPSVKAAAPKAAASKSAAKAAKPTPKPVKAAAKKPVEKPSVKPTSVPKAAAVKAEKAADKPVEKSVDKLPEKAADKSIKFNGAATAAARPTPPVSRPESKAPSQPKVVAVAEIRKKPVVTANDSDEADMEGGGGNLLAGPRNVTPYQPKRGEQYMNKEQMEHFRNILFTWKRDLMEEVDRTVLHMKDEAANFPDPNDRATQESEFSLELRTRDRERKLIRKIDEAIGRIDDGSYGYCVETGEEIGIKRLEARPVATLCVEAQERRERREKQYGDRDDRYR
jgi:DnaK suppressor protein